MALPAELLQAGLPGILSALRTLNDNGFRLPLEQTDVIYTKYLEERSEPFNWLELEVVLFGLALARHPKAPAFIEYVFGMEDFDFTGVACRALLAWHGMPDLFLIWVDELDSQRFDQLPTAAQDYMRGVDLSGTWQRSGIDIYFEDATPEKLRLMSLALVRMGMPESAAALDDAAGWWQKMEGVHALNLPELAHFAEMGLLRVKWEAAAWRMNDSKNCLLEGISRFAAKHSTEFRNVLGWTDAPPAP